MIQALVRGHGDKRHHKVLDHVWLSDRIPDVSSGDLDMTLSFQRVIKDDAVTNYLGFALGKVAPAAHADQRSAVAGFGGNEEGKNYPGEDGNKSFH